MKGDRLIVRYGEGYFKVGCGSKLTIELLTWHTCLFLSAESKNKLVIRGHLLPPGKTYSQQERSVGGQPGVLAAVGSSSSVDSFTPHPEPGHPSCGSASGWEEAGRERCGQRSPVPASVPACRSRAVCGSSALSPAAAGSPLGVGAVGLLAYLEGREQSVWEKRAVSWALPFPSCQEMQFSHWFLAPEPPRLKKNIQGDSV